MSEQANNLELFPSHAAWQPETPSIRAKQALELEPASYPLCSEEQYRAHVHQQVKGFDALVLTLVTAVLANDFAYEAIITMDGPQLAAGVRRAWAAYGIVEPDDGAAFDGLCRHLVEKRAAGCTDDFYTDRAAAICLSACRDFLMAYAEAEDPKIRQPTWALDVVNLDALWIVVFGVSFSVRSCATSSAEADMTLAPEHKRWLWSHANAKHRAILTGPNGAVCIGAWAPCRLPMPTPDSEPRRRQESGGSTPTASGLSRTS